MQKFKKPVKSSLGATSREELAVVRSEHVCEPHHKTKQNVIIVA